MVPAGLDPGFHLLDTTWSFFIMIPELATSLSPTKEKRRHILKEEDKFELITQITMDINQIKDLDMFLERVITNVRRLG